MHASRAPVAWIGLLILLVAFAVPLFVGLREPDMRSDEAIYSYAVERILETGEWLTPRSIPSDEPFVEKPPLKFWMVAGAMTAGVLPRNEAGMRAFDALFGSLGFIYVFLIGRRLAGTACGLVAVLTLFTLDPLLFEHGLRSNDMEGPLFLAYCGGVYHFMRWVESERPRARAQAWAVAACFTLGFMTKFVAVLFLPIVGIAALAWRPAAWARVRAGWTDWIAPVAVAVAVPSLWFLYEHRHLGEAFWRIIFGTHVYQRFTSSLDPTHLNPWHYYFSETWRQIAAAGTQILVAIGVARLAISATRDRSWPARLVLIWGVLPMALISLGTSKLLHYAYPFWPPLGVGAGLAFVWLRHQLERRLPAAGPADERSRRRFGGIGQRVLTAVAVALIAIAIWTAAAGPLLVQRGDVILFRNTTVVRPLVLAGVLLFLAVYSHSVARQLAAGALAVLLPIGAYADRISQLGRIDHPLRATRDCVARIQASGVPAGDGVLNASRHILHHSYYYYLWRLGPWVNAPQFPEEDVHARLTSTGRQTPVILERADFERVAPGLTPPIGAVRYDQDVGVLLPGPFAACEASIRAAGGLAPWQ